MTRMTATARKPSMPGRRVAAEFTRVPVERAAGDAGLGAVAAVAAVAAVDRALAGAVAGGSFDTGIFGSDWGDHPV